MEKRPPTGIWGGLWSLPEFDGEQAALDWCISNNARIVYRELGIDMRHTFSHFQLDYTPLVIEIDSSDSPVMEAGKRAWFDRQQIRQLGIAAPIKLLLQQHFKGSLK